MSINWKEEVTLYHNTNDDAACETHQMTSVIRYVTRLHVNEKPLLATVG